MNIKRYIPNTITSLNLACGASATLLALVYQQYGLSISVVYLLIALAAVFDFCDGAAARILDARSEMGRQLDSLSDLVSFGLAPGAMIAALMIDANPQSLTPWLLACLWIPVAGGLRLARFNASPVDDETFTGLPIPANALMWIGIAAWIEIHGYPGNLALGMLAIIIPMLMVCRLRMFSLKFHNFDFRENFRRYMIIVACIVFVATEGLPGLAWTILFYILLSLLDLRKKTP